MATLAPLIVVAGATAILILAFRKRPRAEPVPQYRLPVKAALEKLDELDGELIELIGILSVEHEDYCINEPSMPGNPSTEYQCASNGIWTRYDQRNGSFA